MYIIDFALWAKWFCLKIYNNFCLWALSVNVPKEYTEECMLELRSHDNLIV